MNFLKTDHLDSLIDRYELLVIGAMYLLDEDMSAKLYMSVFAHYSDLVATLESYIAERTSR